jgi:adenylate kinase
MPIELILSSPVIPMYFIRERYEEDKLNVLKDIETQILLIVFFNISVIFVRRMADMVTNRFVFHLERIPH